MATCSLKRQNPFDNDSDKSDSLSSSLKRLNCSSSPQRMDSARSSPAADSAPSFSPFPELPNGDLSQKILSELRKLQQRINAAAARKNDNQQYQQQPEEDPQSPREIQQSFSVNQVRYVCSKLLKERENEVRAEYDKVLNARLAEQYEAFVKFAQDQIQNQQSRSSEPSYFS
ncbi:hypothetical protein BV898_13980 [Hypsibius exemplaris]|uniref:Akirin n=1 Tax=Hypsibius exemplaris TaxID=2072580 RepID=A0A1W0W927_HYPEX|nr:hypothetical protein BV898_13980 [Hypsibius exemplaris]